MRSPLWFTLSLALVAFGCSDSDSTPTPTEAPTGAVFGLETDQDESSEASDESASEPGTYESLDEMYHHSEVALVSQGDATLLPFVEPMRRARQRMTIPQLSDSLTQVTGGLGWTQPFGSYDVDLFWVFASSLGVPDYVEATREDRSASALFHKFLDEAARHACSELVLRETGGEPFEPYLMVHATSSDTVITAPEAIDDNLRYLLLRYHGRKVVGDAAVLNAWRWLFESVTHVTGDPAIGWRGVCIGLISHPDFYSF
jgi:hypothetical protein